MKKTILVISLILSLMLILSLASFAAYEDSEARVFDSADLLTESEESELSNHIKALEEKSGTRFYFVSHKARYSSDEYTAKEFIADYGISDDDFILLTVIKRSYEINYYIDTLGNTYSRISDKEANYILDDDEVYDGIKYGSILSGSKEFFTLSEKAYSGRLGAAYSKIVIISLFLSAVIAFIVCASVYASYKKKQRQVKYPLDRYAKLELTDQNDVFTGSYVTRRRIQRSSGSSGGGSGGSRRGGR